MKEFKCKALLRNAEGLLNEVLVSYRDELTPKAARQLIAIKILLEEVERGGQQNG